MGFKLRASERHELKEIIAHTQDATILRRSQAVLWLSEGMSVIEVAKRLDVSRQVVYQWVSRYEQEGELAARLAVGERSGRPRTVTGIIEPLIDEAIDHDRRMWGYNSTVWTARLLQKYLEAECGVEASVASVRLALGRLGISWGRPRYKLALRPETWRQAKGGLKKGCGDVTIASS